MKAILTLACIVALIESVLNDEVKCPLYECGLKNYEDKETQQPSELCIKKFTPTNLTTSNVVNYVRQCSNTMEFYCPDEQAGSVQCKSRLSDKYKSRLGGRCLTTIDCSDLTNRCINNKCVKSEAESKNKCDTSKFDSCPIGSFCKFVDGVTSCVPTLNDYQICDDNYQCRGGSGCVARDKVKECVPFFSRAKGESDLGLGFDPKSTLRISYCATGYSFDGKCAELNEKTSTPSYADKDGKCKYSRDGTDIDLDFAECGFSSKSTLRVCQVAPGSQTYKDYIKALNDTLQHQLCLGTEKKTLDYCAFVPIQKFNQYNNTEILRNKAVLGHKFFEAQDCVKDTLTYLKNRTTIIPEFCGSWSCQNSTNTNSTTNVTTKDTKQICAYVANATDGSADIVVVPCKNKTETCELFRSEEIYKSKLLVDPTFKVYCSFDDVQVGSRYPGEPCYKNEDCYIYKTKKDGDDKDRKEPKVWGWCYKNKCERLDDWTKCNKTEDCYAGQYCNTTGLTAQNITDGIQGNCTKLKKEGDRCFQMEECENHLGCLTGRCTKYVSMEDGSDMSEFDFSPVEHSIYSPNQQFCKSGFVNPKTKRCDTFNLTGIAHSDGNYTERDNSTAGKPYKCPMDSECKYTSGDYIFHRPCECALNKNKTENETGYGYCPIDHSDGSISRDNVKYAPEYFNSKCHVLNSANCDKVYKDAKNINAARALDRYRRAHLLEGADSCIMNANASFLQSSLFYVAIVLISQLLF